MNRPLSLLPTFLISTLPGGCSGKSTTIDFDRDANFSQFKTFAALLTAAMSFALSAESLAAEITVDGTTCTLSAPSP